MIENEDLYDMVKCYEIIDSIENDVDYICSRNRIINLWIWFLSGLIMNKLLKHLLNKQK